MEVKVHDCSVTFFLFLVLIARNLARSLGVLRTGINYPSNNLCIPNYAVFTGLWKSSNCERLFVKKRTDFLFKVTEHVCPLQNI